MKTITFALATFVLCAGLILTGYAANGDVLVPSVASHEATIQQHHDKAAMLEQQIEKLEHRLDMVKDSYRDPKGFRSASWERLIGTWCEELKDTRAQIVWHEEQVARLKTRKKRVAIRRSTDVIERTFGRQAWEGDPGTSWSPSPFVGQAETATQLQSAHHDYERLTTNSTMRVAATRIQHASISVSQLNLSSFASPERVVSGAIDSMS